MRTAVFAAVLVALVGTFASEPAEAHGRARVHVGVGVGYWGPGPFWGPPWWHYPPAYYYPAPIVVREPVTYIEQGAPASSAPAADAGWWYYCDASKGYYPYVKECPSGWQRVPPAPPPAI